MTRVLVTGATGYIGSQLVRHLVGVGGYTVQALTRPGSSLALLEPVREQIQVLSLDTDISVLSEVLEAARPDVVVHLAAMSLGAHTPDQVDPLIDSNIRLGVHLLEAMVQAGIKRFLNTGTYWETMDGPPAYRPVSLYAATKRAFDDILRYYEDAEQFLALTLRLHDTYGPGDPRPKFFTLLKNSVHAEEPVPISPGEQVLDLVYIDDVVHAYELAIRYLSEKPAPRSEAVYIGSGRGIRLKDAVSVFEKAGAVRANVLLGGRPYRPREVMLAQADIEPARTLLGWEPRISLEEGLRRSFFNSPAP